MTSVAAPSRQQVLQALRVALMSGRGPWDHDRLQLLPDKGLAHDHVRLLGAGVVARIPKQSQLGLAPLANLEHQWACFERAAPSGHTPGLRGWLPPAAALPRGALLVEDIEGPAAALPQDLEPIASALARIHRLPLPPAALRPPLASPPDPLRALWLEIEEQSLHFGTAGLAPWVLESVQLQRARLAAAVDGADRPPVHLIAFDSHPGNFIIRSPVHAVLVDLEKCRYSYPGLDLAHATLYTSTTWDVESCAVLSTDEVLGCYRAWAREMGTPAQGAAAWHVPLRRAMWLWSLSWCAKWRATSGLRPDTAAAGEDWSAEHSDPALIAHVRGRVDHYLSEPVVRAALAEFDALDAAFSR